MQKREVIINRNIAGDIDDLKAILRGNFTYEKLIKMAEDLVNEMDIYSDQSTLPHKPDLEKINDLCVELVEIQGW